MEYQVVDWAGAELRNSISRRTEDLSEPHIGRYDMEGRTILLASGCFVRA
jgi:hypothetical protein